MMDKLLGLVGLRRANLENPRVPFSDFDLEHGGGSTSGVSVTQSSALRFSPVWRAVTLISGDVAKLPLHVYQRTDTGKERAPEHPAYRLLRRKPNDEMTASPFRQALQAAALLRGNGYAFIERDAAARPVALIPLNPDPSYTYPVRENGLLWYVVQMPGGELRRLRPDQVLHIKGLGFDGLVGYSAISYGADSIGLGLAAHKYSSKFFSNAARPSVVLEHPATLNADAVKRLRDQWDKMYSGLDNSHKTAVLEEGLKAHVLSISARDAQLIESMAYSVKDVANLFGVPPHKLGDSSRTAYNSLEAENQAYLDESLDPWLVKWEEECWDKLLTEEEKDADSHFVEFLRAALVRADLNARANYYQKALGGAPWLEINEVRAIESLNWIDGGDGLPKTNNYAGEQPAASADDSRKVSELVDKMTRSGDSTQKYFSDCLSRAAKRCATHRPKFADDDAFLGEHREQLVAILGPAVSAVAALSGQDAGRLLESSIFEAMKGQP